MGVDMTVDTPAPAPAWRFLLRKLTEMLVVLLGASFLMFLLAHIIPGDPVRALFGFKPPPPEVLAELRGRYGLDDPFFVQYAKYLRNLVQGEMGYSIRGIPVWAIIKGALPNSLRLLLATVAFQVIIGIGAAVVAVSRRGRFVSSLIRLSTLLLLTVPIFIVADLVQATFGQQLGWFPTRGLAGGWRSFVLPAFTLAVVSTAYVVRMAHAQLVETMDAPFIRMQRANGISRQRLASTHALRASLVPIVTLIAASISQLIAALIIVETVFRIPGIGATVLEAVRTKDHNVLVGILVIAVFFVILTNWTADFVNGVIDPRLRTR
jgi:ABC-type dipeptide/oligopeptide/nickel transport system permease component